MGAVIFALIRPFLGYIIGVAALVSLATGFYFKARHDGVVAEKIKIEQEKRDAIQKANAARDHVRQLCTIQAVSNCPAEWFRD